MENNNRGFTLVEMIVVLAILAILTAIAIPTYGKFKTTTYKAAVKGEVRGMTTKVLSIVLSENSTPTLSPNPCTGSCTLNYGSKTENIAVSKLVSVELQNISCPDGSSGFKIIGTHDRVPSWSYEYNFCDNKFTEH